MPWWAGRLADAAVLIHPSDLPIASDLLNAHGDLVGSENVHRLVRWLESLGHRTDLERELPEGGQVGADAELGQVLRRGCRRAGSGRRTDRYPSDGRLLRLGEEVVALVIDHHEGGEVLHLDAPHGFHAEFLEVENLDLLDAVEGEAGGRAADRSQIEASVGLARLGDDFRSIPLWQHHVGATGGLELIDVPIHPTGGGGTERT